MIFWNKQANSLIDKLFQEIKTEWKINFNFWLLTWPSWVGKTTLIKKHVQDILWKNYQTDSLYIKDYSNKLWKQDTIKIDLNKSDKEIDIPDYWKVIQMSTRDILWWTNKTSIWKYKILLIENIERMTTSSANAFLKTFEETNKDTLIITTTSNPNQLLDTILSRAFIINFNIPIYNDTIDFLVEKYPNKDISELKTILSFCMGKVWPSINFIENKEEDKIKLFKDFLNIDNEKKNYSEKIKILKQISKIGYIENFLDSLIYHYDKQNKFKKIQKIIKTKQLIKNNVNRENALFWMIL